MCLHAGEMKPNSRWSRQLFLMAGSVIELKNWLASSSHCKRAAAGILANSRNLSLSI
ncbi:MAG: hypothetical protein WC624_04390 [Candidatus Margulisiibacteriota bacterium]